MQEIPIVLGFTAGELSPWLACRFDLQAYQRGAAEITNFQILPYGGIQLRPGTTFVDKLETEALRLVSFCFSENDVLLLVFHPGCMHVYRDGRRLPGKDGFPYVLSTPWNTAEELAALHFNQVNDAVYVCCPMHPPVVLYRYHDTEWSCVQPEFHVTPRELYAHQEGTLSVKFESNGQYADLSIQGDASPFFDAMAGSEILLADATIPSRILFANQIQNTNAKAAPDISTQSVAVGTVLYQTDSTSKLHYFYRCIRPYPVSAYNGSKKLSDYPYYFLPGIIREDAGQAPYEVQGDWELTTSGTWNGYWELWRSYDTPEDEPDYHLWNWTRIKSFSQSDFEPRQNWAISGSESRPCRMALVCRCSSDSSVLGAITLMRILGGQREYRFSIESVKSATEARARVLQAYLDGPVSFSTCSWSFAAFGQRNGYPSFSALFQGRLWLGGMPGLPTTLLGSVINDFTNFRMGANDDDAMHLSLMGSDQSRICWMCAARQLLVGTTDGEWVLVSGNGGALTPTSVSLRRQSSVGSDPIPARAVENTVLFVQHGGRRLREIAYRLESDGFSATDISLLAEHLFAAGVKDWCVQRGAHFNVWVLMKDCTLAMLTINMEQQVTAWQRVELAGRNVLGITSLRSVSGKGDEMWFAVKMHASGQVLLERMEDNTPHLDCSAELVASDPQTIPPHLAGEEVRAVDRENGVAVLTMKPGRRYRVGIPITARLQTLPMEGAASFNSVRQFSRFKLRLLESDTSFDFRSTAHDVWEHHESDADTPYTGALRLAQMPDAAVGQSLCIRYSGCRDFRLLAITQEVDHHGK